MVQFPPQVIAFQYQSGLDRIVDAYSAATGSLWQTRSNADEAYWRYVDSGQDDSEYDEDGCLTSSTAFELQHAGQEADYALRAVREAFITSTFHYWERWARSATGLNGQNDGFEKLRSAFSIKYPVSPHLRMLNHLNNVLKHNSDFHAVKLAKLNTSFFSRLPMPLIGSQRLYWMLRLTDSHVDEVFEIVRTSGPQYAVL